MEGSRTRWVICNDECNPVNWPDFHLEFHKLEDVKQTDKHFEAYATTTFFLRPPREVEPYRSYRYEIDLEEFFKKALKKAGVEYSACFITIRSQSDMLLQFPPVFVDMQEHEVVSVRRTVLELLPHAHGSQCAVNTTTLRDISSFAVSAEKVATDSINRTHAELQATGLDVINRHFSATASAIPKDDAAFLRRILKECVHSVNRIDARINATLTDGHHTICNINLDTLKHHDRRHLKNVLANYGSKLKMYLVDIDMRHMVDPIHGSGNASIVFEQRTHTPHDIHQDVAFDSERHDRTLHEIAERPESNVLGLPKFARLLEFTSKPAPVVMSQVTWYIFAAKVDDPGLAPKFDLSSGVHDVEESGEEDDAEGDGTDALVDALDVMLMPTHARSRRDGSRAAAAAATTFDEDDA